MTNIEIFHQADKAGREAVEKLNVVAMVVERHSNMMNDNSPVTNRWVVEGGPCGFAWVNIKPANGKFAKWMVGLGNASKDSYAGGVTYWIHDFNQSMQRKEAYAYAFAKVLNDNGIRAFAGSRMD